MVYVNRLIKAFDFKKIFQIIKKIGYNKYLTCIFIYPLIVFLITISLALLSVWFMDTIWMTIISVINIPIAIYILVFGARFKGLIYTKP